MAIRISHVLFFGEKKYVIVFYDGSSHPVIQMSKIVDHLAQMLLRMQTRCFAIRTVSWNTSTTREGQPYDNYTGENHFTAVPEIITGGGSRGVACSV